LIELAIIMAGHASSCRKARKVHGPATGTWKVLPPEATQACDSVPNSGPTPAHRVFFSFSFTYFVDNLVLFQKKKDSLVKLSDAEYISVF